MILNKFLVLPKRETRSKLTCYSTLFVEHLLRFQLLVEVCHFGVVSQGNVETRNAADVEAHRITYVDGQRHPDPETEDLQCLKGRQGYRVSEKSDLNSASQGWW